MHETAAVEELMMILLEQAKQRGVARISVIRLHYSGKDGPTGLIEQAGVAGALTQGVPGEEAWIEVIRKMDEVYGAPV